MKEFFFDDDTFTDDLPRAEAIASELGKLGVTWSCNAKANVPRETLKVLKDNGLRLLLVGYESGNQQILHNIKKGMRVEVAEKFTKDCHELGITIHGTFILGLPGRDARRRSRRRSSSPSEINPHTIQVSLAAPYPGTFLYKQAVRERLARRRRMRSWSTSTASRSRRCTIRTCRTPRSSIRSRASTASSISAPGKIASIVGEMVRSARHDEAAPARRRRVLPVPEGTPPGKHRRRLLSRSRPTTFSRPFTICAIKTAALTERPFSFQIVSAHQVGLSLMSLASMVETPVKVAISVWPPSGEKQKR